MFSTVMVMMMMMVFVIMNMEMALCFPSRANDLYYSIQKTVLIVKPQITQTDSSFNMVER